MPLVVKLSMVVVLTVNTSRQRGSKRIMRAPRMRLEPAGRRGFELFAISSNRSQQQAAQRARLLATCDSKAKSQTCTNTRAPDVVQRGRGRAKYTSKRATCARDGPEPRTRGIAAHP